MIWWLANWRMVAIAAAVGLLGLALGISRVQLSSCRLEAAEFRRAYDLLSQAVATQNAAVQAYEQKAAAAAQRGAQARREASGAIEVAQRHAEALERVLRAPRMASECPAGDALAVVRSDLAPPP